MRTIFLLFDSLNRHFLNPYGCDWTITPNFSRLAEKSVTFDTCYAGSLPCMPARRELHTGRYNFLHRSWGPLEPFDDSLPELLRQAGVYTHMISDHQHYWEDGGCTYHHRYDTWEIVRGQEGDRWKARVKDPEIPPHYGRMWRQDIVNRKYIKCEEDFPQAQVFKLGLDFLDKNKDEDNWFLHLETFDPHEPFVAGEAYRALYPSDYAGLPFNWPAYRKVTEPEDAVAHCRLEYAALLTMCDAYLGKILDYMDDRDMWKNTALIVCTDHGFLLSEHDCWAKCVHPFYEEVAHIPLFIWDPTLGIRGERRRSLTQTVDLPPTILDFYGMHPSKDMQGKTLRPVLESDAAVREYALFGVHGGQVNITDGRYVYMREGNEDNSPLYNYTVMPTHMRSMFSTKELQTMEIHPGFPFTKNCPVMRMASILDESSDIMMTRRLGNLLFDLYADPKQEKPLKDPVTETRMIKSLIAMMRASDAPGEQYKRLGLTDLLLSDSHWDELILQEKIHRGTLLKGGM
ncbi:MAG: sulfatase [Oscillospiraceae bacterium]|jgi:arylsulfatase A-like enzyme|nr:sulfatase [Oscillospiraceae bacterium]